MPVSFDDWFGGTLNDDVTGVVMVVVVMTGATLLTVGVVTIVITSGATMAGSVVTAIAAAAGLVAFGVFPKIPKKIRFSKFIPTI